MTDTDKLKRLAEACSGDDKIIGLKLSADEARKYSKAILALIAESEAKDQRIETQSEIIKRQAVSNANICQQRDEAVTLLRETEGLDFETTDLDIRIDAFLARIDAAD